jgi:hypothetical protein
MAQSDQAVRRLKGRKKKKVKGFKNVQADIARRKGISSERAGRILGAATRDNPILRRRAAAGRKRARKD